MRLGPSSAVLASAASWGCRVSSRLGTRLVAADVPILRGRASGKSSLRIPLGLQFTVPASTTENGRTIDWLPRHEGEPLARYGQTLDLTLLVDGMDIRIGRYLITDWQEQSNRSIRVEAAGMTQLAADDRLIVATGPRDDGTLRSEFLRLLPPYMTASFHPSLVDRPCPRAMEWPDDRLAALEEIAAAWPARIREDEWGQIQVLPPLPDIATPQLTLKDGEGGTVIGAPIADTRQGAYNVFVARSSASGVDAQAVAKVLSGPMNPDGDYHPVPKFFASQLLENEDQCMSAATAMRDDSMRRSRTRTVTMAPDPRLDLDDAVELITDADTSRESQDWGWVTGYDLPLTPADGDGRLEVTATV